MRESWTSASEVVEPEITLTRFYVASPRQVFDMWTQRRLLRHWWGPEEARLADCDLDVRPGGTFRFVLRYPGGKEVVEHGSYLEVRAPTRLTFMLERDDLPGEALVTSVACEEMGAMTRMTVHQSAPHSEPGLHRQLPEWLEALTRLSEQLE